MESKAKIAVGVLIIAILVGGFLVFTPYGRDLWGEKVSVATVTTSFGFRGTSSSAESLNIKQVPSNAKADVDVSKVDKDKYQREMAGNGKPKLEQTEGKGEAGARAADVSVVITFTLKTPPNNETVEFSFDAAQRQAAERKEFKSYLGPNELNNTTGTFYLDITIQVSVEPPAGPSNSFTLHPVDNLEFKIPK